MKIDQKKGEHAFLLHFIGHAPTDSSDMVVHVIVESLLTNALFVSPHLMN